MNINIYNPYVRAELELYHHGIAGQKWGKRNGPPYPLSAGAHSASEKKAGWRKSLDKSSQATESGNSNNTQKAAVDRIKKAKLYTEEDCRKANTPEGKRRNRENADLGLKALDKMGRDTGGLDVNNITNDYRNWFVYEDQTVGLFTIADLVNRGKSKQEIVDLINDSKNVDYDTKYNGNVHGVFQLSEAGNGTDVKAYIDACIDVKNCEKRSVRETLKKNGLDYNDYKASKEVNKSSRSMSDDEYVKKYIKDMNAVPDYNKAKLKKYNISDSEFIKARKAGETGISLEKKLFAYEDYLDDLSPSERKDYERLRKLEKRGFLEL